MNKRKGKTYEEQYGVKKAKEVKEKMKRNHKGMLGLKHSKETIEKMINSPVRKTKEYRQNMRKAKLGRKNPMYGKHLSEEHKQKLREANLKNGNRPPTYYAEEHPNWKGGWKKYYGPNWVKQKNLARKRDNYICQLCLKSEKNKAHDVHHKIPFRTYGKEKYLEANKLINLITLCVSCHSKIECRRKSKKKK